MLDIPIYIFLVAKFVPLDFRVAFKIFFWNNFLNARSYSEVLKFVTYSNVPIQMYPTFLNARSYSEVLRFVTYSNVGVFLWPTIMA